MWRDLPEKGKQMYKDLILGFSSSSVAFAQKSNNSTELLPIVNSKYQEVAFQKAFGATSEDIGNSAYDASLIHNGRHYLIGIKTFGYRSGYQKIAQFKKAGPEWGHLVSVISDTASQCCDTHESNVANKDNYQRLAELVSTVRNLRIDSAIANLRGFKLEDDTLKVVESVYHTLMPALDENLPVIKVGETTYNKIDVSNIEIEGCSDKKHPNNFTFVDNTSKHKYRYTSSDCQLLMDFSDCDILDTWQVKYAESPFDFFLGLKKKVYGDNDRPKHDEDSKVVESYSWSMLSRGGEVARYSGWNSFYGLAPKSKKALYSRLSRLKQLIPSKIEIFERLESIFDGSIKNQLTKERVRSEIMEEVSSWNNAPILSMFHDILYRTKDDNEMYIPLGRSRKFHDMNPNFFGPGYGEFRIDKTKKLVKDRVPFVMVFEPSGKEMEMFITQDDGKGIQSFKQQSILGAWIRELFQLKQDEPLTKGQLERLEINGFRMYKLEGDDRVHFEFIWIDEDSLPEDYFKG